MSAKPSATRLDQAIRTTLGELVNVNGKGNVIAPRGMTDAQLNDHVHKAFDAIGAKYPEQKGHGYSYGLENTGDDGKYTVKAGNGYLLDANHQPIVIDILNRPP